MDLFVNGNSVVDGTLMHQWFDGTWHDWESINDLLVSGSSLLAAGTGAGAVSWEPGRIDVFVTRFDGWLALYWFDGQWNAEALYVGSYGMSPGTASASNPAVCTRGPGMLDVFAVESDLNAYHLAYDGALASQWENVGRPRSGFAPTLGATRLGATSLNSNSIDLFAYGGDNVLYHNSCVIDSQAIASWQGWQPVSQIPQTDVVPSGVAMSADYQSNPAVVSWVAIESMSL